LAGTREGNIFGVMEEDSTARQVVRLIWNDGEGWTRRDSKSGRLGSKPKPLSAKRERFFSGVGMNLVTAVEYLEALLVLAIFIFILATGFKVWRWNYMVPPR
jgi:hypothetical protein